MIFRVSALLFVLLIMGCDATSLNDRQRDEVGDIAEDIAYDSAYEVVNEHEKIKELESRIETLEAR